MPKIYPALVTRTANVPGYLESRAVYSRCENYRYLLERTWSDETPSRIFVTIGLNPSTATHVVSDPTITRLLNRAKEEGFHSLLMLNIFAFRATEPKDMRAQKDPIGTFNNHYLRSVCEMGETILCAWGTHGNFLNRQEQVMELLAPFTCKLKCLKMTKNGFPGHPLYVPSSAPLIQLPCLRTKRLLRRLSSS